MDEATQELVTLLNAQAEAVHDGDWALYDALGAAIEALCA